MPDEHDPKTPPDTVPDSEESGTARPNIPQAILDALPDDIRTSVIQAALFSGPLPPPGMYREYEEVLPGSANRLMELTEDQQKHRHKWESDALDASISDSRRGQWFGFFLSILAIMAAVILALMGRSMVGALLALVSVSGIAEHLLRRRSN